LVGGPLNTDGARTALALVVIAGIAVDWFDGEYGYGVLRLHIWVN